MCSCLQGDEASRYLSKRLLHRFRCRRYLLFQNDFACFIQNTVERPTISQIHTDGLLLLMQNFVPPYLHSANLLHRWSPFLRLERVVHWERIASRWRPAFSSHLINVSASIERASSRRSEIGRGVLLLRHWVRFAVFNPKSHRVGALRLALFVYHNNFAVCVKRLILLIVGDMVRSQREEVVGYENRGA